MRLGKALGSVVLAALASGCEVPQKAQEPAATAATAKPEATGHGQDQVIGLLALPEVFGNDACDRFAPREITLYAVPDPQSVVGSIRVDRYWTFPTEGGCEGLRVGVHKGASLSGVELPTLEYGYEQPGAIVLQQQGPWFKVRLADGAAWLRAAPQARYFPLERLLINGMTYLTQAFDGRLAPSPGATPRADREAVPGRDVNVSAFDSAGGQLWIHVEILSGSVCAPGEKSTVIQRGWLPAHAPSGEPTVWFYSRGC